MTSRERIGRSTRADRRPPLPTGARSIVDELDGRAVEVHHMQPYRAIKPYRCPGCHSSIPSGTGHLVVVPADEPGDRRHWHRSCWERRLRRRPR